MPWFKRQSNSIRSRQIDNLRPINPSFYMWQKCINIEPTKKGSCLSPMFGTKGKKAKHIL